MIVDKKLLLANATKSENELDCILTSADKLKIVRDECESTYPLTHSSQKAYLSLKGLYTWSPIEIRDSRISLGLIGQSRNSCKTLVYEISATKNLTNAVVMTSKVPEGMKTSLRTYNGSFASFWDANVQSLSETLRSCSASEASKVGNNIQNFVWSMGRLDFTTSELQSLMTRYKGKLIPISTESFMITIEFEGLVSRLSVDFKMESSYPSLPLEVSMNVWEGLIDLESIRKTLAKNAKPGFGYLSRACDIVSTFVE